MARLDRREVMTGAAAAAAAWAFYAEPSRGGPLSP
jgi:hypothetical protein